MSVPTRVPPTVAPETAPEDFPIEWLEPRDAELTWEWDDMHMPQALTPLAGDYVLLMTQGFGYGYERLDVPIEIKARIWNGYAYFAADIPLPESEHDGIWQRRSDMARQQVDTTQDYWISGLDEIRAIYANVAAIPVEDLSGPALADAWDLAWLHLGRPWRVHFYVIRGPYQVLEDLADLYESIVDDAAPGDALALIGGGVDELQAVETELEALVTLLRATPELLLGFPSTGDVVGTLAGRAEAAPFLAAFDTFLARHGHLGQSWDDLAQASWIEAPDLLMAEIAKRAAEPSGTTAEARRAALTERAEALAARARERLADDPERARTFEATLAAARLIGPITETHNYWIDRMVQSLLRRLAMRVGARLVRDDVVTDQADVLYLHVDEITGLLREPANRDALIADRRADHAYWSARRPPRKLGKPSEDGDGGRFDGIRIASTDPHEVRGTGASTGVARGPARVVLDQATFGAVQPGDIIVCTSSNPSWVPLFAIAGGLVTDTGGVLSHAGVVAREFGLPAVVGTRDGTTRIADGRLVELDGSTGVVRLL
jgi:pyruvate,water dikinase